MVGECQGLVEGEGGREGKEGLGIGEEEAQVQYGESEVK